jgi:hypothetical protein
MKYAHGVEAAVIVSQVNRGWKKKRGISEPKRNACDTCRIMSYLNSSSNKDFRAPSSANACIHALTNEP